MKKVYWIIIGIVIALAAAGFIWFRSAYALIGGQIYDRNVTIVDFSNVELKNPGQLSRLNNLQHADLRHTDLSVKDYEKIRTALPDCEILWLVPFQGQRLDPESTGVTMTSATEEDIALLAYFPNLEVIDMTACTDTNAALKVMELYPQCKVQCMIPFQGQTIPYDIETLTISSLSQEDISMVRHFTELKSINLQETCSYITETNHTGGLIPMFVSKAWFDGLAPIQQEAILKGFAEVTEWREENLAADVAAAWQAFEDAGAEIVRLEDVDIAAFQEACSGVAAEFIARGDFTQEFYDALKG